MSKRKAIVSGIICTDVQVDKTSGGKDRVRFTVAVNEVFGNKKVSTFIPCTAYETGLVEFIGKYFYKGKPIEVEGRLNPYRYERDGQKRSGFEVLVDTADFVPGEAKKPEGDEKEDVK